MRVLSVVLITLLGSVQAFACAMAIVPRYVLPDFAVEVRDWNGNPIAGMEVRLTASEAQSNAGGASLSASTDQKGRAQFQSVAAGDYDLTTQSANGEYLFVTVLPSPTGQSASEHIQSVESTLRLKWPQLEVLRSRAPIGRLRTGDDAPVQVAISLIEAQSAHELATINADVNGEFRFQSVTSGMYFLRIKGGKIEGDIAVLVDPEAAQAGLDLAIVLSSCGLEYTEAKSCEVADRPLEVADVCGAVLDPTGAAIWKAKIELIPGDAASEHYSTEAAPPNGTFALQNVKPGSYTMSVSRDGFRRLSLPVRVLDGRGTTCTARISVTLGVFTSCSKAELVSLH